MALRIVSEQISNFIDGDVKIVPTSDGGRVEFYPLGLSGEVGSPDIAVRVQQRRWVPDRGGLRLEGIKIFELRLSDGSVKAMIPSGDEVS